MGKGLFFTTEGEAKLPFPTPKPELLVTLNSQLLVYDWPSPFQWLPLWHLPPRHCGRVPPGSLTCSCSLFSGPQSSLISNSRLKMVPGYMGSNKMNFFYNADLLHRKNHYKIKSPTGFKASENCGFFLQLGLPVYCYQGCLVYLIICCGFGFSSPGELVLVLQTVSYFCLHCLSVLLCYHLFLDSWCFSSLSLLGILSLLCYPDSSHSQIHMEEN
jgi:hypothetical protein